MSVTVLDQAIERARSLPPSEQALIGGLIFAFTDDHTRQYRLSARQIEETKLTQQEIRAGHIASDADMDALWKKFGV